MNKKEIYNGVLVVQNTGTKDFGVVIAIEGVEGVENNIRYCVIVMENGKGEIVLKLDYWYKFDTEECFVTSNFHNFECMRKTDSENKANYWCEKIDRFISQGKKYVQIKELLEIH
jgi:G:T-mismatch repair DNA endonuclease (very short patch repair protein)